MNTLKLSQAIILGDPLKKCNPKTWLSDDGSCGCAFGGAVLAAGIGGAFLAERDAHPRLCPDPSEMQCVLATWPWLTREITHEITKRYDLVASGHATIEDVAAYVRTVEPTDEPSREFADIIRAIECSEVSL